MAFYPPSQIKTNLHTNGGEFILSTTKQEYKGYYYKISNGKNYTGISPNDTPNILLEPIVNLIESTNTPNLISVTDDSIYSQLRKTPGNRYIPQYSLTTPTITDYQLGLFSRYFCKKTNELKYIEISKETYNQLNSKNPQIAWDLYTPISTLWYITGDKEKVTKTNYSLIYYLETTSKLPGFTQYFQGDFSKYFK